MNALTRKTRTRARAFTLLEVLMVVVIIGLLAAFVVPSFFGAGEAAKTKLAEAAVAPNGGLPNALKMFRMAVGRYPTTDEGLKVLYQPPDEEEAAKKWKSGGGPFIEDPGGLNDPWGRPYVYVCPGRYNTESFDLSSLGPDGQESDDDLRNWKTQ